VDELLFGQLARRRPLRLRPHNAAHHQLHLEVRFLRTRSRRSARPTPILADPKQILLAQA